MPDLAEQIRSVIDEGSPSIRPDEVQRRRSTRAVGPGTARGRRHRTTRHRVLVVAAGAVLVVVAVGVAVHDATTAPREHPTVIRPAATSHPWRLVASLSGPRYVLATGTPGAIDGVDCTGDPTCFLSTDYGVGGATSITGATYVSRDSGHTWGPTTLPPGVATSTLVSCVTATWCAAGGGLLDPATGDPAAHKEMRDPELLTTTDAGSTWTLRAIPMPVDVQQLPAYGSLPAETTYWPGTVDAVSCSSPGVCHVVGHVETNGSGPLIPDEIVFLTTTDGGVHWTSTVLPERPSESDDEVQATNGSAEGLSCPSTSDCVVVATLAGFIPTDGFLDAWTTHDGGATFREQQIPDVSGAYAQLSCPTVDDCWTGPAFGTAAPSSGVALRSTDGGSTWTEVALPALPRVGKYPVSGWQSVSCSTAADCFVAGDGIAGTVDGGSTWTPEQLPAGIGTVVGISCQPDGSCVAVATPASGSPAGGDSGSLVLTNEPSRPTA
jgi:photosystem II stability/assembly factor-like uncharacterized protein